MSDEHDKLILEISDDSQFVEIALPSQPATHVICSTAAVDSMLRALGLARTGMLPAFAAEWAPGQPVERCYREPKWSVETDCLAGDALLHLRDERLGWLHYVFDKAEALRLARDLAEIAAMPPPAAAGSA